MPIVKGEFISEWEDGTELSTYCELNTDTGEVHPETSDDTDDHGFLVKEFFRHTDGEELEVCEICHSYLFKEKCSDPGCSSEAL